MGEVVKFKKKKGLSGSALKWIAIASMILDHIGGALLFRLAESEGTYVGFRPISWQLSAHPPIFWAYLILRIVGRIAFPIYLFLLAEGVIYTSNPWKYLLRLGIFAIISEIPFDLALNCNSAFFTDGTFRKLLTAEGIADVILRRTSYEFLESQNVFFTLSIALFGLILVDKLQNSNKEPAMKITLSFVIFTACCVAATLLHTDYLALGILGAFSFYYLRKTRWFAALAGNIALWFCGVIQIPCIASMVPILCYNGQRGKGNKWVFYAAYPVHLLILGVICLMLKI